MKMPKKHIVLASGGLLAGWLVSWYFGKKAGAAAPAATRTAGSLINGDFSGRPPYAPVAKYNYVRTPR